MGVSGNRDGERAPLVLQDRGLPPEPPADSTAIQISDSYLRELSKDQQEINMLAFTIKTLFSFVWELTPVLTGKGEEMGDYRYFYASAYALVKLTNVLVTRYGKVGSMVLDPPTQASLQAQADWLGRHPNLVKGVDAYLGMSAILLSILYPVLTLANVAALDPNSRPGDFPISKDDFWLVVMAGFVGQCVVNVFVWWPFRGGEGRKCLQAWAKVANEFGKTPIGHAAAMVVWLINSGVNAMRAQYAWHLALTAYATFGRVFHIDCLDPELQRRLSIASYLLMGIVGGQHALVDFDRNLKVVKKGVHGSVADMSLPYLLMACMYAANDLWGTYIVMATLINRHKGFVQYDCSGPTDHPSHDPANAWIAAVCWGSALSFMVASYAFNWGTRQPFKAGMDGYSLRTLYRGTRGFFCGAGSNDGEEHPREALGSTSV